MTTKTIAETVADDADSASPEELAAAAAFLARLAVDARSEVETPAPAGNGPGTGTEGPERVPVACPPASTPERVAEEPPEVPTPTESEWATLTRMAEDLARSNMLPGHLRGKPTDVLTTFLVCRDLGLPLSTGLFKVHLIEGRPTLAAEIQVGIVRQRGHSIRPDPSAAPDGIVRDSAGRPVEARVFGMRADTGESFGATYSLAEAAAAGRVTIQPDGSPRARSRTGGALPWESNTADMLWARACTRLTRRLFSDVLAGVTHTPEELGVGAFGDLVENETDRRPADRPLPEDCREIDERTGDVEPHRSGVCCQRRILERFEDLPAELNDRARKAWVAEGLSRVAALTVGPKLDQADRLLARFEAAVPVDAEVVSETGSGPDGPTGHSAPDACPECGVAAGLHVSSCPTLAQPGACPDCGETPEAHADGCPQETF